MTAVPTPKQRELILAQFTPDIATQLLNFGNYLSTLDADLVVFMARASLCLYDVLVALGIRPIEKPIISDRALDFSLEPFRGRRVALIDDTLILGTSLGRKKRLLEKEAGAEVTTHVFCIDADWWTPEVIEPDFSCVELSDRQVMAFCASEVRAFSLLPRPYLVDFPFSDPIKLRWNEYATFLSSVNWTSRNVTSALQARNGVFSFTFFPSDTVIDAWKLLLPRDIFSHLDILKVRTFVRRVEDVAWLTLVPVATVRPISHGDLERLLRSLLDSLEIGAKQQVPNLGSSARSPTSRCRLTQYILSVAVGRQFLHDLSAVKTIPPEVSFSRREADRHFGPWLSEELKVLLRTSSFEALGRRQGVAAETTPPSPSCAPQAHSDDWGATLIESAWHRWPGNQPDSDPAFLGDIRSVVSDFADIFSEMHDRHELAARKEARQLGAAIFEANAVEAPNRDRLSKGVSWGTIVSSLSHRYGVHEPGTAANLFSLVLDVCNDLGVAVPIVCDSGGSVYRAYRHGENVKYAEQDDYLAWEVLNGFCQGSNRSTIPHLAAEKALVLLMRIGAALQFMEPIFGRSGIDGIVRIDFDLKGAVPIYSRKASDRRDRDIWLTKRLLHRGVLRRKGQPGPYTLGEKPGGHTPRLAAGSEAFELGYLIGQLYSAKGHGADRAAPLDDRSLTLLATCASPRSTAAALQAEMNIFCDWYAQEGRRLLEAIDWSSAESLTGVLAKLRQSRAAEAVNSAEFKFAGYRQGETKAIVADCAAYLGLTPTGPLAGRKWQAYWEAVWSGSPVSEAKDFDPWIAKAATLLWELSACLSIIELALDNGIIGNLPGGKTVSPKSLGKFERYYEAMRKAGLSETPFLAKLRRRFGEGPGGVLPPKNLHLAQRFAQQEIERRIAQTRNLVESIDLAVRQFEEATGRHDFSHLLWYDIIDSTGTRAREGGRDVEQYRGRVRRLKEHLNGQIQSLEVSAKKQGCMIYCVTGDKSSYNDEKHIFVGGRFARRHLVQVLEMLREATQAIGGVRVRMILVPTTFVGSSAFLWQGDAEVSGERFLEHLSRLKKKCRELEERWELVGSFVSVADDRLIRGLEGEGLFEGRGFQQEEVQTEIEGLSSSTRVVFGWVV